MAVSCNFWAIHRRSDAISVRPRNGRSGFASWLLQSDHGITFAAQDAAAIKALPLVARFARGFVRGGIGSAFAAPVSLVFGSHGGPLVYCELGRSDVALQIGTDRRL